MLQRGHRGDESDLASILCKYDLRKCDLFGLSWAKVRRVMQRSISSGSKRHCIHAVELSGKPCANCVDLSRPQQWGPDYRFWAIRPCGPAGWLAMFLIKAGDVEINPGPTTTRKQVWICDICHRQIQVRK